MGRAGFKRAASAYDAGEKVGKGGVGRGGLLGK